jgi:hypothetical protein
MELTLRTSRTVAVAVAMALLLTGCGGAPARSSATAAPTASATPTPVSLAWRTFQLPVGVEPGIHTSVVVSPLDGTLAWACSSAGSGRFAVWASHDGGVWSQVSALTPDTPVTSYGCDLVADQGDAHTLVAQFSSGAGASGTLRTKSYLSTDAGKHWRAVPGRMQIMNVGTTGGRTYAIMLDTAAGDREKLALVLSNDSLYSWRVIRPPDLAAGDGFFDFWLNPSTGELLAPTYENTLWRAASGGANWTRVKTPDQQTGVGAWLPDRHEWLLCGWAGTAENQTRCSHDLGANWTVAPPLSFSFACASCGKNGAPYSNTNACPPQAIVPDGSLLTFCGKTDVGAFPIYELTPNSTAWTSLGTAPCGFNQVTATRLVWCFATGAQGDALAVAQLPA